MLKYRIKNLVAEMETESGSPGSQIKKELSDITGLSISQINRIINTRIEDRSLIDIAYLRLFADYFEVTIDDLVNQPAYEN